MKYHNLNHKNVEAAPPKDKQYKLADGRGLYLLITTRGTKLWRFDYRFGGKRKTLALGIFPDVSLALARARHHKARVALATGIDPAENVATKVENSFASATHQWLAQQTNWTPGHRKQVAETLKTALLATMGEFPVGSITPGQLLQELRKKCENDYIATAHRLRGWADNIFNYAISCGYCTTNPATMLKHALPPQTIEHMPTVTEPIEICELLRNIHAAKRTGANYGLQLIAYVFTRPSELRCAKWSEFDFNKSIWTIPEARTKLRRKHLVPLAAQALQILKELHTLSEGKEWVLPSSRMAGPISAQTWLRALYATGAKKGDMSLHGWRGIASTLLHESAMWRHEVIETQLAHTSGSNTSRAYNYAIYLPERIEMMQWYANHLDGIRDGRL